MATKKSKEAETDITGTDIAVAATSVNGIINVYSLDLSQDHIENLQELLGMISGEADGLETDDDYVYRPPYVYLVQAMTNEDRRGEAKNGEMVAEGEVISKLGEELKLYPLMAWVQRMHMEDSEVVCSSRDGKYNREGEECARCSDNKWIERTPPKCTKQHVILFLAGDMREVYQISFQKTSSKAGEQILKAIRRSRGVGQCVILLGRTQMTNKRGEKYYVYKVKRGTEPMTAGEVAVCKGLSKRFTEDRRKVLIAAESSRSQLGEGTVDITPSTPDTDDVAM